MTTIPKLSRLLSEVLTERAETLARASGFVRRRSKLSESVFVQTLVFGWLGTLTAGVGLLSRLAGALGVRITPQGLEQRFTQEAAAFPLSPRHHHPTLRRCPDQWRIYRYSPTLPR